MPSRGQSPPVTGGQAGHLDRGVGGPDYLTMSPVGMNWTTEWALNNTLNATNATAPEEFYRFYRTEQLTFMCILFAFIVIGNIAVLAAILSSKNRKSRMNFFIVHLALADLSTGMIAVLTDIVWKVTVDWYAGNIACKIVRYMQCVATFASTYVLVALSIDRLDAIARPMNFSGSSKRAKILICTAWSLSFSFAIPMLILNKETEVRGKTQCWISMEPWEWMVYVTSLAGSLFIIPAIIIAICYTVIVVIIWQKGSIGKAPPKPLKSRRFAKNGTLTNVDSSRQQLYCNGFSLESKSSSRGIIPKAKIKTVKMTLVIVLVFIVCWSPFFVFDLLDVYGLIPMSQRKIAIAIFIQSLAPLNSAANPVIYCLFSTRSCTDVGFRLCNWLSSTRLCKCVKKSRSYRHQSFSTTNMTDCSNTGRHTRSTYATRRHSGSPYVKVKLNERENEILLKHVSKKSQSIVRTTSDMDTECQTVSVT